MADTCMRQPKERMGALHSNVALWMTVPARAEKDNSLRLSTRLDVGGDCNRQHAVEGEHGQIEQREQVIPGIMRMSFNVHRRLSASSARPCVDLQGRPHQKNLPALIWNQIMKYVMTLRPQQTQVLESWRPQHSMHACRA